MALTDPQKAQTRKWLGVPDVSRQYDLRLESSMDSLSPEGETEVAACLVELAAIDAQLSDARACRLKLSEVEDITFLGPEEVRTLWRMGNQKVQILGVALYFEPRRRAFGTQAASWAVSGGHAMRRG